MSLVGQVFLRLNSGKRCDKLFSSLYYSSTHWVLVTQTSTQYPKTNQGHICNADIVISEAIIVDFNQPYLARGGGQIWEPKCKKKTFFKQLYFGN